MDTLAKLLTLSAYITAYYFIMLCLCMAQDYKLNVVKVFKKKLFNGLTDTFK